MELRLLSCSDILGLSFENLRRMLTSFLHERAIFLTSLNTWIRVLPSFTLASSILSRTWANCWSISINAEVMPSWTARWTCLLTIFVKTRRNLYKASCLLSLILNFSWSIWTLTSFTLNTDPEPFSAPSRCMVVYFYPRFDSISLGNVLMIQRTVIPFPPISTSAIPESLTFGNPVFLLK